MECNKFSILQGCHKCQCSLNDSKYIPLLTASSIVDILDIVMKECSMNSNDLVVLNKSSIDCSGNIIIVYSNSNTQNYIQCNKYICYEFIHIWLKYNASQIYTAMEVIYLILCASILSCNEREQKALELIANLEILFNYIQRYITLMNKSNNF